MTIIATYRTSHKTSPLIAEFMPNAICKVRGLHAPLVIHGAGTTRGLYEQRALREEIVAALQVQTGDPLLFVQSWEWA